ncbi:hypothetical protein D3C78_1229940 [compost metagenome]
MLAGLRRLVAHRTSLAADRQAALPDFLAGRRIEGAQIIILRAGDEDETALCGKRAAKRRHADRDWQAHLDAERPGILDGTNRHLPLDLLGLHVDRGHRAIGRSLAGNAESRKETVLVDGIGRTLHRHEAHAGIDAFAAACRCLAGCGFLHLNPEAEAHVIDENGVRRRVSRKTAPVHAAERTRE